MYRESDIISEIWKGKVWWVGHVEKMSEERTVKKVFKNIPEGKRSVGKPRKRWLDDVENDLKKMGVRGRINMARNTDAWIIFQESKVLQGSYSRRAEWHYSKTEWHKTTHTIRRNISRSSVGDRYWLHLSAWKCPKDTLSLAAFASARAFHLVYHVYCR